MHWTFHYLKRSKQNSTFRAKIFRRKVLVTANFPTKGHCLKCPVLLISFQVVKIPRFFYNITYNNYITCSDISKYFHITYSSNLFILSNALEEEESHVPKHSIASKIESVNAIFALENTHAIRRRCTQSNHV